jgi:hypothetical protein
MEPPESPGRFKQTKRLHPHVVHICVDSFAQRLRVTVPACLGAAKVTEIIEGFIEAATYSLRPAFREFTAEAACMFRPDQRGKV